MPRDISKRAKEIENIFLKARTRLSELSRERNKIVEEFIKALEQKKAELIKKSLLK